MAFDPNDIEIVLPENHALDMFSKEGGAKSNQVIKDIITVDDDLGQTGNWKIHNLYGKGTIRFQIHRIVTPSPQILINMFDNEGNQIAQASGADTGSLQEITVSGNDFWGTVELTYTADVYGTDVYATLTYDLLKPDAVLLPGSVLGWDSSPEETARYQYRKIFIKNNSDVDITSCLIYGIQDQSDQIYDQQRTTFIRHSDDLAGGLGLGVNVSHASIEDIDTINLDSPFGPDRVGFITKLTEDTASNRHYIQMALNDLENVYYSGFVYLKKGTADKVRVRMGQNSITTNSAFLDVDLTNGTLGSAGTTGSGSYNGGSFAIERAYGDWYKVTFSFTTGTGGSPGVFAVQMLSSSGTEIYVGTSRYVYVAAPYMEPVSWTGQDYIPNKTDYPTIVTRGGVIKFALEKDVNQNVVLDGEEVIKDYTVAPSLSGPYDFLETDDVDNPQVPGNSGDGIIPSGSAQGVWIRQELFQEMFCGSNSFINHYFDLKMQYLDDALVNHTFTFRIKHTRLNRTTLITSTRKDEYNPMTVIIDYTYTMPDNYFVDEDDILFGVYVDREFIKEVVGRSTKVQLESIGVGSVIEIFAHPHAGFQFIRERQNPGNKIKMRFRAKDPSKRDVTKHNLYWDAGLGGAATIKIGEVDALTGKGSGPKIKSAQIINHPVSTQTVINEDSDIVENEDGDEVIV